MEGTKLCRFCLGVINNDKFIDLEVDGNASEEAIKTRDKLKVLLTEEVSFRILIVDIITPLQRLVTIHRFVHFICFKYRFVLRGGNVNKVRSLQVSKVILMFSRRPLRTNTVFASLINFNYLCKCCFHQILFVYAWL